MATAVNPNPPPIPSRTELVHDIPTNGTQEPAFVHRIIALEANVDALRGDVKEVKTTLNQATTDNHKLATDVAGIRGGIKVIVYLIGAMGLFELLSRVYF